MAFKEPGGSLPPLHKLAIGPYLQQDLSIRLDHNHLPQIHPNIVFPSTPWPPYTLDMHFWILPDVLTDPAHYIRLDLRFLIILGEEYNACSSALCNFLHSPVISSFLTPNIFLGSSLKVRDQVSQSYNTTGNT